MIRQARVKNLLDLFVLRQEFGDLAAVRIMLQHANSKSLHPAQNQPAFKWRQDSPRRLLQKCQPLALLGLCANYDSAEAIAVSVQEFRGRVDYHISAEIDRALKIG